MMSRYPQVSHKMPAASGNDASPILGIPSEQVFLRWIDLITDDTGDGHRHPFVLRSGPGIAFGGKPRSCHQGDAGDRFAARDVRVMKQFGPHARSMPIDPIAYFVYDQIMDANSESNTAVSGIAAAIGEPARARMLYCLIDGHARTSTELAIVAEVSPSTASVHLNRLRAEKLVKVLAQGKHRYYSLQGPQVATVLEGLSVLAGAGKRFVPNTPNRLRAARTCYDHIAGTLGVAIHDRFCARGWLATIDPATYALSPAGEKALEALGIDVEGSRLMRRRFAYACLDWSERRPHLGGALGAALMKCLLRRRWVSQELDGRALAITSAGRRELLARFDLRI
jgi:DNA-binding transcriptional ArsR family regulator